MKRFTIAILVTVIVLIIVVPTSLWFLVFEKPIKTPPNQLVLTNEELPGWELVQTHSGSDYAQNDFHNSSVVVGYNLSIFITSFS